ncbi:MAG: serine/threonine-protein kinase, partial [Gemmatimonadetes bacterium]|nr:serine/threonine-protein kinase [Gemmatimonadota bacterium]
FLAEIETTANLTHPHILPLHDSGEADGFLYYVMPYVEGESLRERLDREHQLPVDEAVRIASDMAEALDYAHRQGVIHRDIKPANVLMHEGRPLIADFGIALAVGTVGATRLTETGLSVGTPFYMSPEQATGEHVVGPASDIYALACLLFEVLVGEPPYVGATAQAVLGKIISGGVVYAKEERGSIPQNVDAAIRKALEKLPADRFSSANNFAEALADAAFRHGERPVGAVGPWKRVSIALAALAAILVMAFGWVVTRPEAQPSTARYNLAFLPGQEHVDRGRNSFDVAVGGTAIVYVGPGEEGGQLWVKRRDQVGATPLPGTAGALFPSISPDGTEVVFWVGEQLRKIPLRGGAAITVADSAGFGPVAWMDDGTLVYLGLSDFRLQRVPATGGTAEDLWPDHPEGHGAPYPAPLPGSKGVLFTLCGGTNCSEVMDVWVLDLRTQEAHQLIPGALRAWCVESGHVVFVRPDGAVFAAPFDPEALELTGTAVPLLEGVKVDGLYPDLAVTPDGTLLMMTDPDVVSGTNQELLRVSREGVVRQVDPSWRFSTSGIRGWALSPDGTRLAIGLNTDEGDDIWIKELDDGPLLRLTSHPAEEVSPQWSRDGQSVYFVSSRREGNQADLYFQRADGAGDPLPVLVRDAQMWQHDITPDGAWLVAQVGGIGQTGMRNIVAYQMEGDTAEISILASDYDEISPTLSPDGRWLAYASQETGEWEIYVRPFPDVTSGKWIVSHGGGLGPRWAHSGRELFYRTLDNEMTVATVEMGESFRVTDRQPLFSIPLGFSLGTFVVLYDITSDDQEFIMVRAVGSAEGVRPPMILVENWLEEVKARVGGGGS